MKEISNRPYSSNSCDGYDPLKVEIGGSHYKSFKIQPVEFIVENGLGFLEGCVIKRMCRYEAKNGLEDLQKAKHEIDLLIKLKYGEGNDGERREA